MKSIAMDRRTLFWLLAAIILLAYVYVLYLAYSTSSFVGTVILGGFPIILLYVVLLVRWRGKKKLAKKKAPLCNKPDLLPEER